MKLWARAAIAVAAVAFTPVACGGGDDGAGAGPGGGGGGGGDDADGGGGGHGDAALDEAGNPITGDDASTSDVVTTGNGRGFPAAAPWVSFYGASPQMGDLDKVKTTFRIINIDADPGLANFSPAQITQLKNGGANRVISYFDIGSCEAFRSYWSSVPAPFVSCNANTAAKLGQYNGFPNEQWMDPSNAEYQSLIVDFVAPRLAATGVDGFFLDNLELLEHSGSSTNGPCSAACKQAGLDLVKRLRDKFPNLLFVMQDATGPATHDGVTGGVPFPQLLDGLSHEDVYEPQYQQAVETEILGWKSLNLTPGGHPFWIGTEDYVGDCSNSTDAHTVYDESRAKGFSPYVTDDAGGQQLVCYWGF